MMNVNSGDSKVMKIRGENVPILSEISDLRTYHCDRYEYPTDYRDISFTDHLMRVFYSL